MQIVLCFISKYPIVLLLVLCCISKYIVPVGYHLLYLKDLISRADSQNYCAQYEESMKSLLVSLHTISFNFRCGGKLDLTSEVGHLGF